MLFILNQPRRDVFALIRQLGGDGEKTVLLAGDAVYWAAPFMSARFQSAGVEEVYVSRDALETRCVELHPDGEVVDYDGMATLIMDMEDKVLCI
ncbi:MAG: hypothetical protein JXL84_09915 [Deltaproteobacteria bacterium]|nr:hypothetical protein [Deltaproteobacteria bacterium]